MKYLIVGGAGFIGSFCVDYLLMQESTELVRVYDNFSSGKKWFLEQHLNDKKLQIVSKDIYDDDIFSATHDIDVTYLFAANPDIAKAITEPDIDFRQGTFLTQIVLESMRKSGCKRLIYASGSGVYGDVGDIIADELYSPMQPISTYGASKLSCEVLICSYSFMFNMKASVFRFGNVVGGRQTHGVAYDFIRALKRDSTVLSILGDGSQSKPYIHISDVVDAIHLVQKFQISNFEVFNVAPNDYSTVTEIAMMVLEELKITKSSCQFIYGGGVRGWKGDVPIVRLNTNKIRSLGWNNSLSSSEAIKKSIVEMIINAERLYDSA